MAATLEDLGLDILKCLNTNSSRTFSLAKHPYSVTRSQKLRHDLERWNSILTFTDRARYIRHLKVMDFAPTKESNADNRSDEEKAGVAYDEEEFDPKLALTRFYACSPCLTEYQNETMLPLAQFIQTLRELSDLIYASTDQISSCILSTLHQHHLNCRLHMDTFSLRSLYQLKSHLHDISVDEYALATSLCLYNIVSRYYEYDTDGRVAYNKDAYYRW
ncbi:hypothetical protein MaudMau93_002137 [Microsporum audouinii]